MRNPDDADVHDTLARELYSRGNFASAIAYWTEAVRLRPASTVILNNLAWLRATEKDAVFYNPDKALDFAQRACKLTDYNQPALLDTLSVSYAA